MINVSELFGPTIQGEGRRAGELATFLRLAGCNLSCTWCDTPYSWDWAEYDHRAEVTRFTVEELAERLDVMPGRIVVTGGEPLLQAPNLAKLLDMLPARIFDVETNGTRPLQGTAGAWDTVTCSPKAGPSAGDQDSTLHPDMLLSAWPVDFKYVIRNHADLSAAKEHIRLYSIDPSHVWLMPEARTVEELTARTPYVIQAAASNGYNFTSRLHIYGWGAERGH